MDATTRKAISNIPVIGPVLRYFYRAAGFGGTPEGLRQRAQQIRYELAKKHLHGTGLEVGALHSPLKVPPGIQVKYVDRMDVDGLRRHYPELRELNLVKVDVIDDGEALRTQAPESQDFIIANHFLEHTQNPIATLERFLQVLRPGGTIYLAVPDKRWTFDIKRPVTPLEHLYRDYKEGPKWSYEQHMAEWVELVSGKTGEEGQREIELLTKQDYSIHFHVWTQVELVEMLKDIQVKLKLPFKLAEVKLNQALSENICILKKT